MDATNTFNAIVKNVVNTHFRGLNLGDPISKMLSEEGDSFYHDDFLIPFYRYNHLLPETVNTHFELVYYYDAMSKKVDGISMVLECKFFQSSEFLPSDLEAIATLFEQFLNEKYGKPYKEEHTKHSKKERDTFVYWRDMTLPDMPTQVVFCRYAHKKASIEGALKLEFQKLPDEDKP